MNYPELNCFTNVLQLEGEIWKDIPGHEGEYQASTLGRIKRLAQTQLSSNQVSEFLVAYKEIILKASNDSRGYPQVTLNFKNRRVARVHRLVVETFLEPPSKELVEECKLGGLNYVMINHIDENIENANIINLEWCSPGYNNTYGKSRRGNPKSSGSASVLSKVSDDDVLEIVRILKNNEMSQEKVAQKFGLKQITVSNIWTGRSWSHLTGIPWKARTRNKEVRSVKAISEQVFKCH